MWTRADQTSAVAQRSRRATAIRLGLTCWLVYSLHFATNMVRENYLALSIGDSFSFRVDPYAGMHDDIFLHPGHGWHIGSNPGASMIGAIPYAISRPIIDRVVAAVQQSRGEAGIAAVPAYDAATPVDRQFYEEAWRRGLDVKFGLASFVMQSFGMAVVSALGVVVMYVLLLALLPSPAVALGLALLYAFGTPVFFRTGFLNHNLMLAHAGLVGFAVLADRWRSMDAGGRAARSQRRRGGPVERLFLFGGIAGGSALLLDYSGAILLAGLLAYGLVRHGATLDSRRIIRVTLAYALGAFVPVMLLWFYQWRSFGQPFLPPQHWMPPVEWSDHGYRGVDLPRLGLARALAFDYRFGLFVSCPLFLLAFALPWTDRRTHVLPRLDRYACFAFTAAFFVFFSSVHYTRWQFNTGVRYLAPVFPFLFVPAALALIRLPRRFVAPIVIASVTLAWSMAMVRDVSGGKVDLADPDTGLGVLGTVVTVFAGGFRLPALTTLSRMEAFAGVIGRHVSPLPLMLLAAVIMVFLWIPRPSSADRSNDTPTA